MDWENVEVDSGLDADTVEAMREVARIAEFNRVLQRAAEPPDQAQTPPGSMGVPLQRWRDLVLLEPIGSGARGEVWRAWDSTLQRQVALKFLLTSTPNQPRSTSSDLLNEARALARVRHPSIVTVHGIAEHEGRIGMWMECVPGVTLAREIERVGALPARDVTRMGLQLCAALEALETAGLVHRDIKPANILLEGEDRVVLTDFGLGWRLDRDPNDSAPTSSGTPYFMAPEVLAGGKPTHQSDLYSLGVTLWWALAGQAPFNAKTLAALRRQAADGPAPSLQSLCPSAPAELVEAILWAMHPTVAQRPRGAAPMTARLRKMSDSPVGREAPRTASIAVLPFVNRNPGNEDEYFSDGLADELIAMLGKIRGVRVAARTSAFTFRGRQTTIPEIGRALNVETVLDGSLRRSGDRIRVSVQLIHVGDGLHLWSETYDRALDDMFAVQDDIARCAVKELRVALEGYGASTDASADIEAEVARAAKGRASNPEAHRHYLVGKHLINRLNREDLTRAIQKLHEAVALEPRFALAWTELAGAYIRAATWGLVPQKDAVQQARDAVRQALSLESELAEAHARLATIQLHQDWNWKGAEASCARALELAPGDASALNVAGVIAMALGRTEQSIALHRRAAEQDPLSASPHNNLGLTLHSTGRFLEAETELRRALELAPQRLLTRAFLARAIADQGRGEEALVEVMREPDEGERLYMLAVIQHGLGDKAASDAALQQLIAAYGDHYANQIADAHAARGDADAAFTWLERAYVHHDLGLCELQSSASFRGLHGDPRWRTMLVKLGLEETTST